jgi:hypothetical protein
LTQPSVFISHHSSQYEKARQVKAALAEAGVAGWLAPDDIDPGSAFDTQIVEQVKRSDAVVLLLCANSDQSRHVKRELMIADDEGKAVFPVRLEPIEARGLAYWLKDYQWIDWIGGKGDGLDRLIGAIRSRDGFEAVPPPAAPRRERRRKRMSLIAAGIFGIVAAAAALVYFLAPGGAVLAETPLKPGSWLARRDVLAITFPDLPPEVRAQMEQTFENDPDPEECISPEVAANPGIELFDPGRKGKCTLTNFKMGGGRMSGYLICPLPGMTDGSVMQITFRGAYTRTTIDMDNDIMISRPGSIMKLKARDSSQWVADQCTDKSAAK